MRDMGRVDIVDEAAMTSFMFHRRLPFHFAETQRQGLVAWVV